METNTRFIRFSGDAEIPEELELGHHYQFMIEMKVKKSEDEDNEDGKKNIIYKVKPVGSIGILDDKGLKTVAKMKGSPSQKLRWEIEKIDDYNSIMSILLNHPEELCEWAIKIKETYGK